MTQRDAVDPLMTVGLFIESDGPGGAETVVLDLARGLSKRGHRVLPLLPEDGEGWLPGQLSDSGIDHVELSVERPADPGALWKLTGLIREHALDVVHGHEFTMAVYGAAACLATRTPLVVTMHGGAYAELKRRRRWALRWAARRSSAFVTVSNRTAARMARCLGLRPEEVEVVHNGIFVSRGRADGVREALEIPAAATLLLCAGSLYRVKGYDTLLHALSDLPEAVRDTVFLAIAGRGEERQELEALARGLGLESRVAFLGHRGDIPALMEASDVFVLPSRSEGLPLALLEAMGSGLPVVATSVGGIPEVVEHETHGLLVPPDDPGALAGAIARLVTDTGLHSRLGGRARSLVLEKFTTEKMVSRYEELYRRALRMTTPS